MDTELKAKWVAALRSGEYEQGRWFLKRDGAYCCLGVLSQIMGGTPEDDESSHLDSAPYRLVLGALGRDEIKKCADLNDLQKYTFAQIADYIEASL